MYFSFMKVGTIGYEKISFFDFLHFMFYILIWSAIEVAIEKHCYEVYLLVVGK